MEAKTLEAGIPCDVWEALDEIIAVLNAAFASETGEEEEGAA